MPSFVFVPLTFIEKALILRLYILRNALSLRALTIRRDMLKSIINSGISEDQPEQLQRRVRLSNITILLLIVSAALPFSILSAIYFPRLTYLPAGAAVVFILLIFVNRIGAVNLSRMLIALSAILTVSFYNYFLCGENDDPIPSILLLQLSFSMIIFVLFDLKEKQFLFPLLVIAVILIVGFPQFKTWHTVEYDQTILREGWMSTITMFFAVLTGLSAIFSLAYLNMKAEEKGAEILGIMEEKNKSLELSEKRMKENLNQLETNKEEERRRNWATEGLARIAEILRNSNDDNLFDQLVTGLVKYLKINQGGLFIAEANEEGQDEKTKVSLTLRACYAYDRKKYVEQTFLPGQGLIGQVYLEKDYIYLKEVPNDYIRITSGLGGANPTSIIVMPLILNENIEGVLELASFNEFAPHEIQFLQKACESMASYIHNNRINRQTRQLLEESMRNAEQLRAQEEEMRQNQEELIATQEEMRRQHEELSKMKDEIEEKNRRIEKKALEQQKELADFKKAYQVDIRKMTTIWMSHLDAAEKMLQPEETLAGSNGKGTGRNVENQN